MTIVILMSSLVSGCGNVTDTNDMTVFRYNEVDGVSSLDPIYAVNLSNINACNHIYNGLVMFDTNMNIMPCVAKRWEVSDDGCTYTFHLRDDVFFHTSAIFGEDSTRKVTAGDFVYSLNRIVDAENASPGSWVLANVQRNGDNLDITAVDDTTLRITLSKSYAPFLSILTMKYCSVVPKEVVEFYGKEYRKHPIGTGPFRFKFWQEDEKLVLTKNQNYFEKDSTGRRYPYLDAVAISFIKDKQTAFLEFVQNKFDYISGIEPAYMKEFITSDGTLNPKYGDQFYLLTEPYFNTEYIGFNVEDTTSPFSDSVVRVAVNYAIDKEKMLRHLRSNIGTPGVNGFIPKGLKGHGNTVRYSYNPLKAKELIQKSRFYDNGRFPEVKIATTIEYADLCNYLQNRLNFIGIPAKVDIYSAAVMKDMRSSMKLQCFRGSWVADYPDAENYLSLFYSRNFAPAGPNYFHWQDDRFDNMYEQSLATTDEQQRHELYKAMDSLVMTKPPFIVLYYDRVLRFVNKRVSGFYSNPVNLVDLKQCKISKDINPEPAEFAFLQKNNTFAKKLKHKGNAL